MLMLLRCELIKTYSKLRTYIGFGLVAFLIPLVYWGFSTAGDDMIRGIGGLEQNFLFIGSLFNGWFVANMVMTALFVHVPFLILLVAGDIFAGEATSGTYRILLTRPPSRTHIFAAKVLGSAVYTFSLVLFLGAFSVALGLTLFGSGDLFTLRDDGIAIIAHGELWWRFLLAYLLAGWAMCVVAALGMLFSSFVENAIGPIVGSFAVIILFLILGNLPYDFFDPIRPFLFTQYTDVWRMAFEQPVDIAAVARELAALAAFFSLFLGIAWLLFRRKDVLS